MRPVIYQLFVRHFSNFNTSGVNAGTIVENGCGKFNQITERALTALLEMGVTHIWLTGILRHATQTSYPSLPAQPRSIVKGLAGSPYAVLDYFDVDPDLAEDRELRMQEFESLLHRCRRLGFIVMIDFVPNHVSRAYCSSTEPENNFGVNDITYEFAHWNNSFYYLQPSLSDGPPLRLPDGPFEPEYVHGRVTGNNAATWAPSIYDWYETVKLNYGANYQLGPEGNHSLPSWFSPASETPKTWQKMDKVLAFWQDKGVGGFRCDMAHMVPMPFWKWALSRARVRNPEVYFIAEAYDDHMKTTYGDPLPELVECGFAGVYDAPAYHLAHKIYEEDKWANDWDHCHQNESFYFNSGIRFIENHDEPRIASPLHWGGVGSRVARAVMAALFLSSRGAIIVYNGQETGEKAQGPMGYGGDNGRTSIFDYTSLPEFQAWTNEGLYDGGKLTEEQSQLRFFHKKLLTLLNLAAFGQGLFYGLNWANSDNQSFGRSEEDHASGHWIYAFLRHDWETRMTMLVVCNLSPDLDFNDLTVHIPAQAQEWCGQPRGKYQFSSMLSPYKDPLLSSAEELRTSGIAIPLKAGEVAVYRWESAPHHHCH